MKRPAIILSIFALLLAFAALAYHSASNGSRPATAVVEKFAAANQSLASSEDQAAIAGYQALLDEGERSASVYYNLALAQHRAGHLGAAILNYERAAVLEPGAADIAANLARARKDAAVPEETATGWRAFAHSFAANSWTIVAAVSLLAIAGLAAIGVLRLTTLPRKLVCIATAGALAAITVSAAALVTQHRDGADRAIVLNPGTPLRVSPFENAKPIATLPAGKTVFLPPNDPHHGYHLVRLESGQTGWLKPDEVEIITHL